MNANKLQNPRRYPAVTLNCAEPTRTKQAFKDECDINQILQKYTKTGVLTHVRNQVAQYGDFSHVESYQDAVQKIRDAENLFSALPAKVRSKFNNDPSEFLEHATNPANIDSMIDMGLAEKPRQEQINAPEPLILKDPAAKAEG